MIVQHNVNSQICRAVRMVSPFLCGGRWHSAGSVIVFVSNTERRILQPAAFEHLYTELETGTRAHASAADTLERAS